MDSASPNTSPLTALLRSAGERLRAEGFNETNLPAHLGVAEAPAPLLERLPLWLARTSDASPLSHWIRLFLLGQSVPAGAVSRHLSAETLRHWCEAGLLVAEGNQVRGSVYLQAFQGLLVASDFPPETGRECGPEHVVGVNKSTRALTDFAVAPQGGRLLDVGTGGGTLALLGARTAETAVGVDCNPRAVRFAEMNAALNGISNVDFQLGDCFVPVEGEQFDRIVANPPFVISPETSFVYRDGGSAGDEFCARLVRQAPRFLREGGYCQLMCNWAHTRGEPWQDRLGGWFCGSGCDALVMRAQTVPADEYAVTWLASHPVADPGEHHRRFERWTRYYREAGIEAVSLGLIALRRARGRANHVHFVDGAVRMNGPCGGQVRNALYALPHLALPDAQLLAQPLKLDAEVRVRRLSQPGANGWTDRMAWLERPRGFYHQENMSAELALALSRADGGLTLGELGAVIAEEASLRSIRALLERGFFAIHSAEG